MMMIFISFKNIIALLCISLLLILGSYICYRTIINKNYAIFVDKEQHDMLTTKIQEIFKIRNNSILMQNSDKIKQLYNNNVRNGRWACEHALKKMKYLHSWSKKQGIKFKDINSTVIIRYVKKKGDGFTINLMASTKYIYSYKDNKKKENSFKIGTYHSLDLMPHPDSPTTENNLVITREWYTDPFADSLRLEEVENQDIKTIILSREKRDLSPLNQRRKKALEYAEKYCGAANIPNYNHKYNSEYKNYNNLGGDCANFASQILYEGGGFSKNGTWNYYRGAGSKAWINAHAFNNYMVYSGRATQIARGNYEEVLKLSYKLLPGDYIAYEKKGKVVHISIVSGSDSKGYAHVISHNTDRYHVPWDLGWSNNIIKFRLVQVHY